MDIDRSPSRRQRFGLVLAGLISLSSIPGPLFPAPDGEQGPPMGVLVVDSLLGLVGVVAVIVAWRHGNRAALRTAAGAIIVNTVTALPAFFADTPAGLKLSVGVAVLVTLAAVVLMFAAPEPIEAPD